jgi:hypothetical protein
MNILINITSYNRSKKLLKLLNQLKGFDVKVWDDSSNKFKIEYLLKWDNKTTFYQFKENHGKEKAWKKFKFIFDKLKYTDYDYYFFLPDDVDLCDEFIYKALDLWCGIKDEDKICLSFSDVKRTKKPCWTEFESIENYNVIQTQWTDLMFICEKRFFQLVELTEVCETRWKINPLLGSGVGSKISNHFHNMGLKMYNTKENLLIHTGNDNSLMNPQERKKTKL